jgi:glutamate-ammonia-ligase adenylyltransferase
VVERSADPAQVRAALERLRRVWPGAPILDGGGEDDAVRRLVAVLAASRSLTRLLERDPLALDVLAAAPAPPPEHDRSRQVDVVAWKHRELLRVAALDLADEADLPRTTAALSALARHVLASTLMGLADERPGEHRLAVIGMGKLGGDELNYASDVDVVLVGEGDPAVLDRVARELLERAGRAFRIDAALRPEGRDGPLVRSLASYEAYWARWAEPWERQALLRAAPAAGDLELGLAWCEARDRVLWDRPFSADDLRHVRALKARAEERLRSAGVAEREVKRGPGGIRDVEFAAQLLQLVHGRVDVEIRTPHTTTALEALARGGYVDPEDAQRLTSAYELLRRVEHALQLEDERQTHTVPADRMARRHLARVLGYRGSPEGGPTELFDRDLAQRRAEVRAVHERIWFRPLLDTMAGVGPLPAEAVGERLAAFGFTDVERTRQAVDELTRGLTRSSRMMQQLLPLLLDWLSTSPDPDLGLLGLRRLATGEQRSRALATAFRDSPEVARHLAVILGTSRRLGDVLVANPDLIERLPDPARLVTRSRHDLVASVLSSTSWRSDPSDRQQAMQRWQQRNLLGIAARDVFGQAGVEVVGADLTALAEASIEGALATMDPRVPIAVVAFGRLGGGELGYASDLDLAFVHEGATSADSAEAERVASGVLRVLGGDTPAERVWAVDVGLRPEGRNGPVSRSIDSWRAYVDRWASTWERQAYLRLRAVAGSVELGQHLVDEISSATWSRPFTDDDEREVRRMKVRIERERLGRDDDPEFNLKLGRGSLSDIEFTVQLLQLRHRLPGAATISSLHALVEAGHLPADEAAVLEESYRFCERTRNRSWIVLGPGDSLPVRPEQITPLARSLGFTVAGLRSEYRRVTRRARRVVEDRFYGRG